MKTVSELTRRYVDELWELRDVRMDGYPLMDTPWPTLAICLAYVVFVKLVGPRIMRDRKPYSLKGLMTLYNLVQIVISLSLFIGALRAGWWNDYSFFRCQPVDYSQSPKGSLMAKVAYCFYVGRFLEFLDTVFFVLRKKDTQVTFLHVFHHGVMPLYLWPNVRYTPGGHATFSGLLNSAVHTFMYTYYLLCGLGAHNLVRPFKQAITFMQLAQFVAIIAHSTQLLIYDECDFPREYAWYSIALMGAFFLLFANFYVQEYIYRGNKSNQKVNKSD